MPQQSLQFSQKQLQKLSLSQTMRQSLMVLQMDMPDLLDYLKNESLGNPLFDVHTDLENASLDWEDLPETSAKTNSLFDYLFEQVDLTMCNIPLRRVVYALIANLDENGYLTLNDVELQASMNVTPTVFTDAKMLLQQLDPPGIGAQTLHECLIIQAERSERNGANLAQCILQQCFASLVNHDYRSIAVRLGQTDEEVQAAVDLIKTFVALPGAMFQSSVPGYILPELKLTRNGSQLSLNVTKFGNPQLVFASKTYAELVQSQDAEVTKYLTAKKAQYTSLQSALQRRAETLAQVARYIVRVQYPYLLGQSATLRPLLLREVAAELQINESTVSRAIHGVYIETERGILPLKSFFVRYIAGGKDTQSVDTVQNLIKQLIDGENKQQPLSDEVIADKLAAAKYQISRRTVTKYRTKMSIGSTKKRREK